MSHKLRGLKILIRDTLGASPSQLTSLLDEENFSMSPISPVITMWKKARIVRNKEDLETALEELRGIREENFSHLQVKKNRDFLDALEIMNGLIVGEIIVMSALLRTEGRGHIIEVIIQSRTIENGLNISS